jgi:hypothetical protein
MFGLGKKNSAKKTNYLAIKSFTYYLPSPPARKHGYQEKEFDQVFSYLLTHGYELIEFKMQSIASNDQSGVWLCSILGVTDPELVDKEIDIDYATVSGLMQKDNPLSIEIEHEI